MIGKKGNSPTIIPSVFVQLEERSMFPFDLLKKVILGYVNSDIVWMIYEEEGKLFKVPFARNLYWLKAIMSEPEFSALRKLPQIYLA